MIEIGLYQKLIDDAIPHTPIEAELAKQIDRLNEKYETQQNIIQTLSGIVTKQAYR